MTHHYPAFLALIPTISSDSKQLSTVKDAFVGTGLAEPIFIANSVKSVDSLQNIEARFYNSESNDGFGVCVNKVVATFNRWDWLLLSNDDVSIDVPLMQSAMQDVIENKFHSDLYYFANEKPRSIPTRIDIFLQISMLNRIKVFRLRTPSEPTYQSFSCVAISRSLWDSLGGFDDKLPFTYEDADFVRRAKALGYKTAATSSVGVHHLHSVSSGRHIDLVLPVNCISALIYADKWHSLPILNRLMVLLGLMLRSLLVPFSKSSKRKHLTGIRKAIYFVLQSHGGRYATPRLPDYWDL